MKNVKQMGERAAFTIVELLTVMAVIAILIGLLVPALGLVHDTAKDLQQKAQFHAIEVGLEAYKEEMGSYPDSEDSQYRTSNGASLGLDPYCGANKLAEALVGYDLMGFHPRSEFTASGEDLGGNVVYNTSQINLDQREDLFLEIEKADAYELAAIYGTARAGTQFNTAYKNYVLGDSYTKRRAQSGLKIGMPILYFKANTKFKIQDRTVDADNDGVTDNDEVYDYLDNQAIIALGSADDAEPHYLNPTTFDDRVDGVIINQQVVEAPVPYNAKSFILMSAGKDGLFGNADDIYNFEKKE